MWNSTFASAASTKAKSSSSSTSKDLRARFRRTKSESLLRMVNNKGSVQTTRPVTFTPVLERSNSMELRLRIAEEDEDAETPARHPVESEQPVVTSQGLKYYASTGTRSKMLDKGGRPNREIPAWFSNPQHKMDRWVGRVALVTGASSGIGAAICKVLVCHGMIVIGVARRFEKLEALAQDLLGNSGALKPFKCDLKNDAEVLEMFQVIKSDYGGVDVCINNAGMSHNHSLLDGTPEQWREMLDINVVSVCLCTSQAIKSMKDRNIDDGQIIHINSTLGHRVVPWPQLHFYAATKHAMTALTEGMRQELREDNTNIRIASISPGLVATEFLAQMINDGAAAKKMYESVPCLEAKDVASSVLHILSSPVHVQIHDVIMRPTGSMN